MKRMVLFMSAAAVLASTTYASAQVWDDPPGWAWQRRGILEDLGRNPERFGYYGGYYGSYGSYTSYGSYSSYSAGAHSARQSAAQQLHSTTGISAWQTAGRQHGTGTHHIPAALPPAPRRGD